MGGGRSRSAVLAALLAMVMLVGLGDAAGAAPRARRLAELNSDLWRTVLSVPGTIGDTTHPYNVGGCLHLDNVVAAFEGDGSGVREVSCKVRRGQSVLIVGPTYEWSAIEETGADKSEAVLRTEALRQLDVAAVPTVRLDGRKLTMTRVVGRLTTVELPSENLFGVPAGPTTFVAVARAALVRPSPGCHAITVGVPSDPGPTFIVTNLQVGGRTDCDLDAANPR